MLTFMSLRTLTNSNSNIDRKKYFQSLVSPDKEDVVEPTKPDVITHANEDKQVGNVEPEVIRTITR